MNPNGVRADVELRDNQGKTALAYAAAAGQLGLVERILAHFTEVKPGLEHVAFKDQDGKTAADAARAAGHKAVAAVLEEYAKDPNGPTSAAGRRSCGPSWPASGRRSSGC